MWISWSLEEEPSAVWIDHLNAGYFSSCYMVSCSIGLGESFRRVEEGLSEAIGLEFQRLQMTRWQIMITFMVVIISTFVVGMLRLHDFINRAWPQFINCIIMQQRWNRYQGFRPFPAMFCLWFRIILILLDFRLKKWYDCSLWINVKAWDFRWVWKLTLKYR